MVLCVLQLNVKKHLVYGSIAFIWIVFPSLEIVFGAVTTDIIDGTCIPFRVYPSYAAGKIIGFFTIFIDYFLPLSLLLFCYARIVHLLRTKVIFCRRHMHNYFFFAARCYGLSKSTGQCRALCPYYNAPTGRPGGQSGHVSFAVSTALRWNRKCENLMMGNLVS